MFFDKAMKVVKKTKKQLNYMKTKKIRRNMNT